MGGDAACRPGDASLKAMRQKMEEAMVDRMERNDLIVSRFLNEHEFRELLLRELARRIYADLRAAPPTAP